jgi:hypothetical protein
MIKDASRQTHSAPRNGRESGFQPTNSYLNGLLLLHALTRRRHSRRVREQVVCCSAERAIVLGFFWTHPWKRSRLCRCLELAAAKAQGNLAKQPGESNLDLFRWTTEGQMEIMT